MQVKAFGNQWVRWLWSASALGIFLQNFVHWFLCSNNTDSHINETLSESSSLNFKGDVVGGYYYKDLSLTHPPPTIAKTPPSFLVYFGLTEAYTHEHTISAAAFSAFRFWLWRALLFPGVTHMSSLKPQASSKHCYGIIAPTLSCWWQWTHVVPEMPPWVNATKLWLLALFRTRGITKYQVGQMAFLSSANSDQLLWRILRLYKDRWKCWCMLSVQEGETMVCQGFTNQSKLLILTVCFVLQMRTLKPRERLTQISTSVSETLILPGRTLVGGSWPVFRAWGLWHPSVWMCVPFGTQAVIHTTVQCFLVHTLCELSRCVSILPKLKGKNLCKD